MFHFQNWTHNGWKRDSMDIAVGDKVQSTFRAPWRGTVVELSAQGGLAVIRMEIDRHGKPFKKQKVTTLHCNWLKVIREAP